MKLRNVRLTLANVARTTNSKAMEVTNVGTIKTRQEDGTYSNEISNYTVDCAAYRGDVLKVKFPLDVAEKIAKLKNHLENDELVEISFKGLKLTPYAMKANDGSVLSGVSAKADDFEIHVKEWDIDEDIEL